MTGFHRWFVAAAVFVLSASLASAQVGIQTGGPFGPLACTASVAGTPEIRPEGYTEVLGDIVITCTGGPVIFVGAEIPTVNLIVYVAPAVPITSRFLSPNGASEALLIIDEAGANIPTGATGGYGPQAPQTLCTTAQQLDPAGPCQAYTGTDNSGQYLVAVQQGSSTPAQNVFQGKVGDYGANSVTFYDVPVLPPASAGVSRIFRITTCPELSKLSFPQARIRSSRSTAPNFPSR